MSTHLRIASATHLAYAPQYIASELGFFADEGLNVSFVPWPAGETAIVEAVRNGDADVVLGSMLFALRMQEDGLEASVVAQSNQQTRHWIVARQGHGRPFDWRDLRGRSLLVFPNPVPTPWVAFRQALAQQGVSLDEIKLIIGYTAGQCVSEFCRGVGDYLLIDPESMGPGLGLVELSSVAAALGPVPWSVYCGSRRHLDTLRGTDAFRRSIATAAKWLYTQKPEIAAEALGRFFPDRPTGALAGQVLRYVNARLWVTEERLDVDQFDRWDAALKRGGLMGEDMNLRQFLPAVE